MSLYFGCIKNLINFFNDSHEDLDKELRLKFNLK